MKPCGDFTCREPDSKAESCSCMQRGNRDGQLGALADQGPFQIEMHRPAILGGISARLFLLLNPFTCCQLRWQRFSFLPPRLRRAQDPLGKDGTQELGCDFRRTPVPKNNHIELHLPYFPLLNSLARSQTRRLGSQTIGNIERPESPPKT